MQVTQIYNTLNTVIKETLGQTDLVKEDLSNIVDVGNALSVDDKTLDNYVRKLVDHIGKVIFDNRSYDAKEPDILMDGWEFGSILEKIRTELPDSVANEDWTLTNGTTYNQDKFTAPNVSAKFFNKRVAFEIDMSFAEEQVKSSFSNPTQLNSFFSMIENKIQTRKRIDYQNLKMRTINNFTAATIFDAYASSAGTETKITDTDIAKGSKARAVNLFYLFKQRFPNSITTIANCLQDLEFIKFAAYTMRLYAKRMRNASELFNIGKTVKFTDDKYLKTILLDEFSEAANVYLQSDTFHDELVKLPAAQTVSFWQGSGTGYDFSATTKISTAILNPRNVSETTTKEVTASGILGVMFDRDALGVCNLKDTVKTHPNQKADFYNNFYKSFAGYFNDYDENFIVFLVA